MEWVETTGKTVSEAKDAALDQLGVDERDAEFDVVSEPKTGLFGRLKEEARVRARVRPTAPRSKEQSNSRRRGRERPRREHKESMPRPERAVKAEDTEEAVSEFSEEVATTPKPSRPRRRGGRGRTGGANRQRSQTDEGEGVGPMTDQEVPLEQQGGVAEEFLQGLFREMSLPVDIARSEIEEDELVSLKVDGANLGHLIGPRGATLHAIQELTRTVVQRQTGSRSARVVVDVAGYREKRRAALQQFTTKVAETVIETGSPQALEAMNAADRKVVHDAVNDITGVRTTSEGEEPRRWVVISPEGTVS